MIPNEDDNDPFYDRVPRIGAFEVSTVIGDTDILLYSKMMSTPSEVVMSSSSIAVFT